MFFQFFLFFLKVFFCLLPFLVKHSFQKHLPLSTNVPLIGHINFIVPVNKFINDSILLSSFTGNVALFDYKKGEHRWIRNHREEEQVKKLQGDEKHASVLISRNSCCHCSDKLFYSVTNEEEKNVSLYINVYDIVNSDLISSYEYKEEIKDFVKSGDKIVIVFKDRIEIGNINDNTFLYYIYFKDFNVNFNFIYIKIVKFVKFKTKNETPTDIEKDIQKDIKKDIETEKNVLFLFCIEQKEAIPYLITIDIIKGIAKNVKVTKIEELKINKRRKHFIKIWNNHLVLIYNRKFLYWIDINIDISEEGKKYVYNYETISEKTEEELFKEENVVNENFLIKSEEETEIETETEIENEKEKEMKRKRKNSNNENVSKSNEHIVIDIFGKKIHYFYVSKKFQLIKELKENEIQGYYYKNGNKEVIIARDEKKEIYIDIAKPDGKIQNNVTLLRKSTNALYKATLVIGLYNSIEKENYYFTILKDCSFTVYRNNDPLYSREEALAYIEQVFFYSFQHLQMEKEQSTYPWEVNLTEEIENFTKNKINILNASHNLEELFDKKENRNSLLPFNLFYLNEEEKNGLLQISIDKKRNRPFWKGMKNETENETEKKKEMEEKKKLENDTEDMESKKKKFHLMNQLLNKVYKQVISHPSVKYSWNYIILVSTRNGFIFAFHLSTGLILYKIDLNQFKKKQLPFMNVYFCSYSLTNSNWGEMPSGKKVLFLELDKEQKRTQINNTDMNIGMDMNKVSNEDNKNNRNDKNYRERNQNETVSSFEKRREDKKMVHKQENEIFPFRMYSKDSVVTVYKDGDNSGILIFDILNGNVLFKESLSSFQIEHFFILPRSGSVIAVDHLLNTRVIHVRNTKLLLDDINNKGFYFYNINTLKNHIRGYKLMSIDNLNSSSEKNERDLETHEKISKIRVVETYRINMNEEKLEVLAMSKTRKKSFFPVKINNDATIQYKYLNNNIICYITKSLNKKKEYFYTLYIMDGVGGRYLFSKILEKYAEPPFHILINENFVIVNYYHSNLHKYVLYVMELLLDKRDPGFLSIISSKKEKTVPLFHNENVLIAEKQYVIDYNIRSFNFTETKRGITNKHLMLLLDTNKIASLTISDAYNKNFYRRINEYITNRNILHNSAGVELNESSLESTTLLFSWGNYLYFTSYQPNGSYDTMENCNILFLLLITILVFVITFLSYIKRMDKKLHAYWA